MSQRRAIRPMFLCLVGVMLTFVLGTGCFDPYKIIEQETLRLPITRLDAKIRCLVIEIVECDGNNSKELFRLARTIETPFGSETFLLPRTFLNKEVDLSVYGFPTTSACDARSDKSGSLSEKQGTEIQHFRQRVSLSPQKGLLAEVALESGELQALYNYCQKPVEPPSPPDLEPPAVVSVNTGAATGSLPSRYQSPTSASNKPLTDLPSLLSLNDELGDPGNIIQSSILTNPVQAMVAQGHWLAVIGKNTPFVHVLDLRTGEGIRSYEILPDACNPIGLDVQGDILAIVCSGGLYQRVMWRSLDPRAMEYPRNTEDPPELYSFSEVEAGGSNPIDIKVTGNWTFVLTCGERDNEHCKEPALYGYDLHKPADTQGAQIQVKLQEKSIEKPVALAVAGDMVFVADSNNAGNVHQFKFQGENRLEHCPLVMNLPTSLLRVNRRYVATAGANLSNEWLLKVTFPGNCNTTQGFSTFRLEQQPSDMVLLSHSVLLLYKGSLLNGGKAFVQVIDLRTRSSQTLPLAAEDAWDSIVTTGERLVLASSQHRRLKVIELSKRKGLVQWRAGAGTGKMFLVGSDIWVFDPLAQRIRWLKDVSPPTPSASKNEKEKLSQPYVAQSISLEHAGESSWMTTYQATSGSSTSSFVMYAGAGNQQNTLFIKTLSPNDGSEAHQLQISQYFLSLPIQGGRVVGDTLYLLLWRNSINASPYLATVSLNPKAPSAKELVVDLESSIVLKKFQNSDWKPVDILPHGARRFVVADSSNYLFLVDREQTDLRPVANVAPIQLSGPFSQMVRVKEQLAVAHRILTGRGGSQVQMIRLADFSKGSTLPAYDDSSLSSMHVFNNLLLVGDAKNDVVMVCDPEKNTSCTPIRVGCEPTSLTVVGSTVDTARLISANACDGTLSFSPIASFVP
ncbi:MAG: hypothetical protein EP343_17010 [Deltaproteobacteria bacterium]|nr:MAG: hypothetical protein EP343_17010 [Deltaproteobacteria bacterium]